MIFHAESENGAKHSPLLLGVWVTEGRIFELQRKFVQHSSVRLCSREILHFNSNPALETLTSRY